MEKPFYVFVGAEIDKRSDRHELKRLYAIKTNDELRIIDNFDEDVQFEKKDKAIATIRRFEKWLDNIYRYKFLTFQQSNLQDLATLINSLGYKSSQKDFPQIMNYKFYNVRNEMTYRFKLGQDFTLKELLGLYGLTYVSSSDEVATEIFNYITLTCFYKQGVKPNREVGKSLATSR